MNFGKFYVFELDWIDLLQESMLTHTCAVKSVHDRYTRTDAFVIPGAPDVIFSLDVTPSHVFSKTNAVGYF